MAHLESVTTQKNISVKCKILLKNILSFLDKIFKIYVETTHCKCGVFLPKWDNKATISSIKKAHEPTLKTSPVSTSNQALQQNINFLPFQLLNSIDTDPVAAPKQNHYTCHIIKPNGTKLIIQTLEPKTIIQTFLCCN
ncbi:hypothetical protein [Candidatus Tisiphia endosymbiont of Parasteatoda lunata]|uniref:hypothetical protein n=1 Tax=Candidatus Tisiphia endosymbiont of Parasteatoda lunata TaxID=3066275 RepID=UPI00313B4895